MPALWKASIFKRIGTGKPWCNTYYLSDVLAADALSSAADIRDFEREFHYPEITFFKTLLSSNVPEDPAFYQEIYSLPGLRSASADLMPLFNAVRFFLNVIGGKPSFKYYRCLTESDQTSSSLVSTLITAISTAYTTWLLPLVAGGKLVDESGNEFAGFSVDTLVKMRSRTRRPRKKSTTPVNPS